VSLKGHGFSRAIEASGNAALAAEESWRFHKRKYDPSAAEAAIKAIGMYDTAKSCASSNSNSN
jgi:hypothetical protein